MDLMVEGEEKKKKKKKQEARQEGRALCLLSKEELLCLECDIWIRTLYLLPTIRGFSQ